MLTVAGMSFSITISVLATTSSTYGPRLVRNFMSDRANQLVLAAFTSTFLYCIVVLRSVHTAVEDSSAFVPVIAVHVAVLLGVVDVGVLVFFIHHIAMGVQVTTIQEQVQDDLRRAVAATFVDADAPDDDVATVRPDVDGERHVVVAEADGYVQSVDVGFLTRWAAADDTVVDVAVAPGDPVLPGDALLTVGGREPSDRTAAALRRCIGLGGARTPEQDVAFALQQLVEIAVRGLASGSNDPYTAVSSLDLSAAVLVPLWRSKRPIAAHLVDGRPRVLVRGPRAEELVRSVLEGVLAYGTDHPAVVDAALRLVARLDAVAPEDRHPALDDLRRRLAGVRPERSD